MVRRLGISFWMLFCGLLHHVCAAESAALRLELHHHTVEWGEALRGHLVYEGDSEHGEVDYTPWREAFHVETGFIEFSKLPAGRVRRRESLRLYPRRPGTQRIPALAYGGAESAPLRMDIQPPAPDKQSLTLIQTHRPGTVFYAGEQILLRFKLSSRDKRAVPALDTLKHEAFISSEAFVHKQEHAEGVDYTVGWSFFAALAGDYRIEAPPIRYVLFGSTRRRFYPPLLELHIKPLPAYIPATVPVGEVSLESRLDAARGSWLLRAQSRARLPVGLPELEESAVRLTGFAQRTLDTRMRTESRIDGLYHVLDYQVPLPSWLSGFGDGPFLHLQYFDPAAGRVQRLRHRLPRAWRIPPALFWAGCFLSLPLFFVLLALMRRYQDRRRFRAALRRARTPHELRRLLLRDSTRRSLSEWAEQRGTAHAHDFAARLNAACYAADKEMEMEELRWESLL